MKRAGYFLVVLQLAACGGGGGSAGTPRDVEISWNANRETAVNAPGGGYRVYYAANPEFDITTAATVDVPYQGGASAPTRVVITLPSGATYIRVTAYSSLNPWGSVPSSEIEVVVP